MQVEVVVIFSVAYEQSIASRGMFTKECLLLPDLALTLALMYNMQCMCTISLQLPAPGYSASRGLDLLGGCASLSDLTPEWRGRFFLSNFILMEI